MSNAAGETAEFTPDQIKVIRAKFILSVEADKIESQIIRYNRRRNLTGRNLEGASLDIRRLKEEARLSRHAMMNPLRLAAVFLGGTAGILHKIPAAIDALDVSEIRNGALMGANIGLRLTTPEKTRDYFNVAADLSSAEGRHAMLSVLHTRLYGELRERLPDLIETFEDLTRAVERIENARDIPGVLTSLNRPQARNDYYRTLERAILNPDPLPVFKFASVAEISR